MESARMGVILDSSILIAGERRRDSVWEILERVEAVCGKTTAALSAVTAVELTHGIYRAKIDADRKRRETFVEELFQTVAVHPLTLEVARLAGRIHGEQMGQGISIDFPDLIIGATALHLGFDVVTLNVRHFQLIPGLSVVPL
ncbi:MAG TPA: PIN domain-containing protein [Terriglobales bacterium]|nr:PIN domain-containing protein [Terriglobales bacterium]